MTLRLRSPAKINLFLHVHSKRNDGYHNLSTLMQTVSLFDDIAISPHDIDQFICNVPELVGEQNLVIRARNLFREKTGWAQPVAITLEKHIPSEAGLGGGSGNAATVLWGLNQLSKLDVTEPELQVWSQELGSDIPFYFSHGTALCEGRGEIVRDLDPFPPQSVTLIKPHLSLKTPEVFNAYRSQLDDRSRSAKLLEGFLQGSPCYENDLESAAFSLQPELKLLKNELLKLTPNACMTGSGSAFFCIGEHRRFPDHQKWSVAMIHRQSGEWYL